MADQPGGLFTIPSFEQTRRFWYQWFLCTDGRAANVQANPVEFARIQWETWSPPCDPPSLSEGLETDFSGRYERVLLDAVGHFPHREAPAAVATVIRRHLGGT